VRRALFLVLVTAAAAALPMLAAGAADGASPEGGPVVRVALALKASNGLHAQLENSEDGTVTLELRRKDQLVTYEAPGQATPAGLKVRFGRLGLIDVAFTPTKTLDSTAPGEGCTGAPRTLSEGVFTGKIDFTGERGFVRIEGPQASGTLSVISPWTCPEAEATNPYAVMTGPTSSASGDEGGNGGSATLQATRRGCSCYLIAAVSHRRGSARSTFYGFEREGREGMKITRTTVVRAPASAFELGVADGSATLRPPRPLSGQATFEPRSHLHGVWKSTIRVPLLGADPIDTGAPGFTALLYHH
jgi:hypothetical protein